MPAMERSPVVDRGPSLGSTARPHGWRSIQRSTKESSKTYEPTENNWKTLFGSALNIKGYNAVGAAGCVLYSDGKWGYIKAYRNGYRLRFTTRLVTTHQSKPRMTKHTHDKGSTDHRYDAEVSVIDQLLREFIKSKKTAKYVMIAVVGEYVCKHCEYLIGALCEELDCTVDVGVYLRRQVKGTLKWDWTRVQRWSYGD